jgi:addiction module HigA family antidote
MRMHNPPHPGEVLKSLCLEPLKLSITDAAKALDVSRKTLSAILNGRAGISPDLCGKLAFSTGSIRPMARRATPQETTRPKNCSVAGSAGVDRVRFA